MSAPPSPSIPSTAASSRTTSPTGSTRQQQHPQPQRQQQQQQPAPASRRPNRAALRDYYNLKSTTESQPTTSATQQPSSPSTTGTTSTAPSALDDSTFSPTTHITTLLSTSNLSDVLRAEASLINEIKGLDGERKALVYDNYSKLITATDTIRRMRRDMGSEHEMAGRGMLGPAVGHIAATVGSLRERGVRAGKARAGGDGGGAEDGRGRRRKERERDTVKWVIEAPKRLGTMVGEGKREEAEREWETVRGLLERWEGVGGVEEVRAKCEKIMEEGSR